MRPPLKRQFLKKLVCAALALVLFAGFVPMRTEAAEYKYAYKIKANTLAPKKKIKLVFNHKYEFARWYKIKLTKRKTITLTLKGLDDDSYTDFEIFDSERKEINCPRLTDTSYRTETLPKGTYYLRIDGGRYYDEWSGRMRQIMWK